MNVHPTKREVRFRDNVAVKNAIIDAITRTLVNAPFSLDGPRQPPTAIDGPRQPSTAIDSTRQPSTAIDSNRQPLITPTSRPTPLPTPAPVPLEFAIAPDSTRSRPWQWFKFLAQSVSGYLLIETDAGIVTINPHAARERIAYEHLLRRNGDVAPAAQALLIPETVRLPPVDFARIRASLDIIREMGFQLEEFGQDTIKIEAVPQQLAALAPADVLSTIAHDLAESGSRRAGERWREELIAKSIAKSFAGATLTLTEEGATRLVEELCTCRMPYICPRGKRVMIFTSTRELDRKFER